MARPSHRGKRPAEPARTAGAVPPATLAPPVVPWAAEGAFLLALALTPLTAGYLMTGYGEPLPSLLISCLVWAAVLLRCLLPGAPPLRAPRFGWALLAFPLIAALSFVVSTNRGATVLQTVVYTAYAALAWLAADVASRGGAGRVIGALLVGTFLTAGFSLQEYLIHFRAGDPGWRVFGHPPGAVFPLGFTNANFLAGYLTPALLLTFGLALTLPEAFKPGMWVLVTAFLTATLGGALSVTGSRGGLLALGAGGVVLALMALLRGELRSGATLLRLLVLGSVLAAGLGLLSGTLRGRQTAGTAAPLPKELCPQSDMSAAGESNRFRVLTWQGTAAMGRERPLLGWGAGSFETSYAGHALAGFTRHAHSGYLQLFAEEGVPGVLAWLALLALALPALWKAPCGAAGWWVPGVAGALAAAAVHNVFDSLLFVPAVGMLTWTLLGLSYGGAPQPGPEGAPAARPATPRWAPVLAGVLLVLTASQALGRGLLMEGRDSLRSRPANALAALETAQMLLPWDHRVAVTQIDANTAAGKMDEAEEAARRVVRLTPEWPPGYQRLAVLFRYQGNRFMALEQYRAGLRHAPREANLLYAVARLLDEMRENREALATYRKLVEVADSPSGQVRALGEIRDYRFARARMALARQAEAEGKMDEAFTQWRAAACLLAERRLLHDGNPAAYIAAGDADPTNERDLRAEEERLWQRLSELFRARGETRLAQLSEEQAAAVAASHGRLEEIIEKEYPQR